VASSADMGSNETTLMAIQLI